MIRYYTGRALQLAGLIVIGETLIIYFGQEMPLLRGLLIAIVVWGCGSLLVGKRGG